MLKSYFKIAWRNLWKYRLFSLINIIGLGLAIAFCFLILIQVQCSFEKDTFHPYPDRTYRILTDITSKDGKTFSFASSPLPLADKLKNEQSGIEQTARVIRGIGGSFSNRIKSLPVNGIYADAGYYELFNFPLQRGKPAIEPYTAVLSYETAIRFFGSADPIGKTIEQKDFGALTITGVFAPLGNRSTHLKSDMAVSMATFPLRYPSEGQADWLNYNAFTFVRLSKGAPPAVLDRALAGIAKDNAQHVDFKDMQAHSFRKQLVRSISPAFENLINNPGVEPLFKVLVNIIMGLLIVSLAGFNYINLTLTRSLSRAREVGVRKVAGAKRRQLILQFLIETVLLSALAFIIGYLGLLFMKSFIHAPWLSWEVQNSGLLWIVFIGFTLLTGLAAGILPARILSSYQPVQMLKGTLLPAGIGKTGFRKVLIVIQFVVSLVFMIFTGTMYSQFKYMATDNENFNRKQILNIPLPDSADYKLLRNEMAHEAGIERIGLTSAPLNAAAARIKISRPSSEPSLQDAFKYSVDAAFIQNMQLQFIAGNNLPAAQADHFAVINEKAVLALGLGHPKDAIGQIILLDSTEVTISGVVKNFSFMAYELPVSPLVLAYEPSAFKMMSVKVAAGVTPDKLTASLTHTWKRFYPGEDFVYSWYARQLYEDYLESEDLKLFAVIVFIVFVIAALGLLGMVNYSTGKRTREVGVRKVMGANVRQIMTLLSWSFLKLILIAAAIALPLGYFLGTLFLNIFTYHPRLGPGLFLLCAGLLFLVGFLTVGIQTYRTALTNPARTLRTE